MPWLRCHLLVAGYLFGAALVAGAQQMPTAVPDSVVLTREDPFCAPDLKPCTLPTVVLRRAELPAGTLDSVAARALAAGFYQLPTEGLRHVAWCETMWSDARMATFTIHHGDRAWSVTGYHSCAGARNSTDASEPPPERQRLIAIEALVDSVARLRRLPR